MARRTYPRNLSGSSSSMRNSAPRPLSALPAATDRIQARLAMDRPHPHAAMPAPLSRRPGYCAGHNEKRVSGSRSAEYERTVGATEPKRIGKGVFDRHLTGGMRNVIQI